MMRKPNARSFSALAQVNSPSKLGLGFGYWDRAL